MDMKRIICAAVIIILAACSSASADFHLEMQCNFPGSAETISASLDLYEQQNRILAVSSLFPEYAVEIPPTPASPLTLLSAILSLHVPDIMDLFEISDSMLNAFTEPLLSEPVKGFYAGNLFARASAMQSAEFQLSDLKNYCLGRIEALKSNGISSEAVNQILAAASDRSGQTSEEKELKAVIQCFDGRYISCRITKQGSTVLTVSYDRSSKDQKRLLFGYCENSLNCYRDISVIPSQDSVLFRTSYYCGENTSYIRLAENRPLFEETLIIADNEKDPVRYTLESGSLKEPFSVSCSLISPEDGTLTLFAKGQIGSRDDPAAMARITVEPLLRPVAFTDKTTVSLSDENENSRLRLTAASNAALLAAEILPALPNEYQTLILKLLYP